MSGTEATPTPIIELKACEDEAPAMSHALDRRIRQQEILAELGVTALQGASFDQLMGDTARLTAEGMQAEFCKVLEHNPAENRFLVRAGVGWEPGIVGIATIGADLAELYAIADSRVRADDLEFVASRNRTQGRAFLSRRPD